MMYTRRFNFFDSYKVIIFDLDNTLYDESTYLFPVYKKIAQFVEKNAGGVAEDYSSYLMNTFRLEGHHNLFDKFISRFNLKLEMNDLLYLLRNNKSPLKVYDEIKELLGYLLSNDKEVVILTNGNVEQQQNKVRNLDIQFMLPKIEIIYANAFSPKPSPFCVHKIIEERKIERKDVILIGDSIVDRDTAKNASIDFINIDKIICNETS